MPINDFYRTDLIHFAGKGIAVFTGNLEKEIIRVLNKEDQGEATGLSETSLSETHSGSRNMNGLISSGTEGIELTDPTNQPIKGCMQP